MLSPNKDKQILARYGIIKPYVMYVGNAYPHKNLERLVLAFKKLKTKKNDLQLVFVGNEDYFYRRLKDVVTKEKADGIIFVGYVPDYELDTFYHNAEAFVWPSLYEGFGLPPLEAMAKGTPVISSEHPCMKEILEDSAYYFDAENIDHMASSVEKVMGDKDLRRGLTEKGYKQVEKYSWKKMARETLEIYEQLG